LGSEEAIWCAPGMDLMREEAIWWEARGDWACGTLDRGGGRSADTVVCSRLVAGDFSRAKHLCRVSIPAPAPLSLSFIQPST
jgi:hypothetical protein